MTVRYVDPAAAGSNDGTSWINAWTNVQSAFDTVTSGDIVYCRGTQTLTVGIDVDTNSGNETNGLITFIGCNASGAEDGTRFTLDANNVASDALKPSGVSDIYFRNIEFKNSTSDGIDVGSSICVNLVFYNCCSHNNGGHGFNIYNSSRINFIGCVAYGNSGDGFYLDIYSRLLFCCSHDNTGIGFNGGYGVVNDIIGCLSYDNGDDGLGNVGPGSLLLSNVSDANADDGIVLTTPASGYISIIIGNRITNHAGTGDIGLNCNGIICLHGWNYLENNSDANIQNNSISQEILNNGASTNMEDQSNTNQGYTSLTEGSEDYNLRSDASLRRIAITIPTS